MNNESKDPDTVDAAFERAVIDFVNAVEIVVHYDWTWTAINLGCSQKTSDNPTEFTFLEPGRSMREEYEDWHSRGHLLAKYRELVQMLRKRGVQPLVAEPPQSDWCYDRTDNPRPWRNDAPEDG